MKKYYYKSVCGMPIIYSTEGNLFSTISVEKNEIATKKEEKIEEIITTLTTDHGFEEVEKEYLEKVIKEFKLKKLYREKLRLEQRILDIKKEIVNHLYEKVMYL